ncbi:MAG: hypothetical protein IK102_05510 [Treponema sp.]|nr:hypothetical protein [Treponema sp.]
MEENELDSMCGISDEKLDKLFVEAVRIENESSILKGDPIQKWDDEKQLPYIEYPDGHREYA